MTLTLEQKSELKAAAERIGPSIAFLRENQEQLDFDGFNVGVSRQDLDEVLDFTNPATILSLLSEVERLQAALKRIASIENSAVIQARAALGESHD